MTDDEWPKPWDIIRDTAPPNGRMTVSSQYLDMGPLRAHDGTVYINVDGGVETDENRDLWMPLAVYLAGGYSDD